MSQLDSLPLLKKRLEETILQLESDQVLQQMRNDPALLQFKQEHIRQIIRQELHMESTIDTFLLQIADLKQQMFQKEDLINQTTHEYKAQIDNIGRDWERYRAKVENDRKMQQEKHRNQLQSLSQDCQSKVKQSKHLRSQIDKYKKQNQNLREDRLNFQETKATLQESINRLKKQLQQRNEQLSLKNQQLQQKRENQIENYQEIIDRMKKDMHYIRECWQKKCNAIEIELKEENNMLVLHYEEKMRKELKEYAQNLRLGNSVIITDSQEIIAKRMEKVQQEYAEQIVKIQEQMQEISKVYTQTKQQIEEKQQAIKLLEDKNNLHQRQREKKTHQSQLKNVALVYEINSLRQTEKKMQIQLKESKLKIEEGVKQRQMLQDQVVSFKKRANQKVMQNEQLLREIQNHKAKISKLNQSFSNTTQQLQSVRKAIVGKEQSLKQKQLLLQSAKKEQNHLQSSLSSSKKANQKLSSSLKAQKEQTKNISLTLDKLHLAIRKSKKDNDILREEIKCSFGMLKTKLSNEIEQITDQILRNREQIQRKNKLKMNELIDQLQAKEKQLIQNLGSQKQQLKQQLDQSLEALQKKGSQLQKCKNALKDSQQERKNLIQDLQKEKIVSAKLQEKVDQSRDIYQMTINRVQKEISRSLTQFYNKWSDNIAHLQGQLQVKEAKIKACVQKMDQLIQQIEQSKRRADWSEEEVKKYRKKYQQVRKERDGKIENLLKQLQNEGKHRLNLQRQLKEVRLSIMRGNNNNNINFSFNDREKDYNVTTNYKNTGVASKQPFNHQREKQLSQIRQMIAKTYKVVGETPVPEKDLVKNLSKKYLF